MEVCETMGITRPTLYRYIRSNQKEPIKKLKQMIFHNSFEEQRLFGKEPTIEMTVEKRIKEMYRLNKKIYSRNSN